MSHTTRFDSGAARRLRPKPPSSGGRGSGYPGSGRPGPAAPGPAARWAGPLARRIDARRVDSPVIDFGRYEGWQISELARHDPEYLRWLSRHSSGIRFRDAIAQYLPGDSCIGRRAGILY